MRQLTLVGGPCDGRTVNVSDSMATCAWLDIPQMFPMRHDAHPWESPVFYVHRYHMATGIYHDGKMPNDKPAAPSTVTLFGPRVERLLAWLERNPPSVSR